MKTKVVWVYWLFSELRKKKNIYTISFLYYNYIIYNMFLLVLYIVLTILRIILQSTFYLEYEDDILFITNI